MKSNLGISRASKDVCLVQLVSITMWQLQPLMQGVSLLLLTVVQRGFPQVNSCQLPSRVQAASSKPLLGNPDLSTQELGESSAQESH